MNIKITREAIDDFYFWQMSHILTDIILSEKISIGDCREALEKAYKESKIDKATINKIFTNTEDERVSRLFQCLNDPDITKHWKGNNLNKYIDIVIQLTFEDYLAPDSLQTK